ncbi:tRNA 2-thiouridine(34) synthase MnmA [Falsiporphyromonas endometrii]|uniref:tRNA-uridine 2-sulfurtransferase n=1 Tax=Falsiporphyromonas endometrii TaxID=1387297 RepID=A0ABV9K8X4_9PORP
MIQNRLEDILKSGKQPTVAALVSGGVDSSVVVHKLVEAGIRPTIFYIRIGMQDEDGFVDCPAEEDIELTTLLARKYDLPMQVVSLHEEYWDKVVSYTIETVRKGLTPNPDMMCNKLIKFGCFEEKYGHNFDYIATGHYATTYTDDGITYLGTAKDPVKDQTDFLAQINFKQISKLLFPIGHLDKSEVREIAKDAKIPSAMRKDSQGICFLGKVNYNDFIKRYLGEKPGRIIDRETGKTIGTHKGYWFHTIGQRKGLGLSGGPWFVVKKDVKRNILLVSRGYDPKEQYGHIIEMKEFNFISGKVGLWSKEDEAKLFDLEKHKELPKVKITFKVRHTPEFTTGLLEPMGDKGFRIISDEPIQGIAPGQYASVYDTEHMICYGSGMITKGK